ncbi:MAG: tRNA 2-thiocytidine(32) synthetase TtcA [Oscillospiraceae bacterium]|nr:tRNA 2-thiocytidine(32) synthetase TtcA [Oscillospiraceae bacterium]
MQKMMSYMRSAMERYQMIEDGDRVAVGLSGGKDSVALLYCLAKMRAFYPHSFELFAVTLDMGFGGEITDYSLLEELCESIEVPYVIKRTEIGTVIFDIRREKNPCSLCARMRRGALHDAVKELGCNKLALGHHMDDAVETFMMNLLNEARIGCFSPVTYLSRKDITMIRPMVFARESDCARVVRRESLPIVKSKCPADGATERQRVKTLLSMLERDYGGVRDKLLGAMQRANLDGF